MMCLYPILIKNRKYTKNTKNGGIIPPLNDERTLYAPIGCGMCIECRKKKSREWQVRLQEDIKHNTNGKFITLTLSNESYAELDAEIPHIKIIKKKKWDGTLTTKEKQMVGYTRDNAIAIIAIARFRERWRKEFKTTIRHWLITELGHNGTENIHLHGIIWTNQSRETVHKIWQYGWIFPRNNKEWKENYVNEKTINYITKYVYKIDDKHQNFNGIILTSPGIGNNWKNDKNEYKETGTKETYRTNTGHKISLPIYYRNKIYTDEEKEKLWLEKLNKNERWILGNKIDITKTEEEYYNVLERAQQINKELGYNNPKEAWKKEQYELERRKIMQETRIKNAKNTPTAPSSPGGDASLDCSANSAEQS